MGGGGGGLLFYLVCCIMILFFCCHYLILEKSLPSFIYILGVWLNRMSPKHLVAYLLFGIGIPMQIPSRGRTPEKVQCYEPATMKYLGFCPALRPDEVSDAMCVITGTGWYPLLSHFALAIS